MYSRRLIFKRIQERDYLNFPFSKHTEHMRSYYVTQFNHIQTFKHFENNLASKSGMLYNLLKSVF